MLGTFGAIIGVLFIIGGTAAFALRRRIGMKPGAGSGSLAAGLLIGLLILFATCTVIVGTQKVGVVTSFGRPGAALSNGFHVIAPWQNVTEIDGRVQTDTYNGGIDANGNCTGSIPVRIAHQQTACLNVSIQWRIRRSAAPQLFRNYGTFDNIRAALVTRKLEVVLNQVFDNYDPIASLTSAFPEGTPQNPTAAMFAHQVTVQMRNLIGKQIQINDVLITTPSYDPTVQARINSVLAQAAQTDIAKLAVNTANAQAAANRALAASVSNNPGVLVSRCLDITIEALKANYGLPATWNCSLSGTSTAGVIVSGKH
jgi:regulator of protease activity HflC (stomatin/prohibitin superfamily)